MATLEKSNTYLTDLIGAGPDAFPNLFYVEFTGNDVPDSLKLNGSHSVTYRINDFSFNPPTHTKVSKDFMTETLEVPTTSFEFSKTFDLKIRLDKDYEIYKELLKLQQTMNALNSTATTDVENTFNVIVYRAPSSTDPFDQVTDESSNSFEWEQLHKFEYCWIKKITPPTFSYNDTSAQVCTVSIDFYKYSGPDFSKKGV